MAMEKFSRISVELSQRIADSVTNATDAGEALTADQRTALVNEAMFKLFEEGWTAVRGDIASFIELFPELVTTATITTAADGTFTIASPLLDLHTVISGLKSTTYIKTLPKHLYPIVKANKFDDYAPTASNPVMFDISGKLHFFPASEYNLQSVTIEYIKVPLLPTTGGFLILTAGTVDSPFSDKWNSRIAALAEDIYRTIAQEKSQ